MNASTDYNNPDLKERDNIYGYYVKRIIELKEISSFLYMLEHTITGARHAHLSNNDTENIFFHA
jgi:Zn-dependent M16 (insulinase) family peptidase